jgi:FixJ family two-component response regulator
MNAMINNIDEDIIVADDLATIMKANGFECKIYQSCDDFLQALDSQTQSLGFFSFGLYVPGTDDLLNVIRDGLPSTKIIITRNNAGNEKPFSCENLLDVVQRTVMAPMQYQGRQLNRTGGIASQLSNDERQIISLLEQGASVKQIAAKLNISIRTVHYRKATILKKTQCKNSAEAIAKVSAVRFTTHVPHPQLPPFNSSVSNPSGGPLCMFVNRRLQMLASIPYRSVTLHDASFGTAVPVSSTG